MTGCSLSAIAGVQLALGLGEAQQMLGIGRSRPKGLCLGEAMLLTVCKRKGSQEEPWQ
jgi:hypothetical protein